MESFIKLQVNKILAASWCNNNMHTYMCMVVELFFDQPTCNYTAYKPIYTSHIRTRKQTRHRCPLECALSTDISHRISRRTGIVVQTPSVCVRLCMYVLVHYAATQQKNTKDNGEHAECARQGEKDIEWEKQIKCLTAFANP